jgi:glycosyltransferase involved in cell wall biosynthesis
MKILFFTYPVAFVTPGGGEIQLLQTRKALQDLGVQVDLFDMWNPRITEYDVIHLFSVQSGVYHLQLLAKQNGIKVVNSPIMWIRRGAAKYDMHNLYHIMANSDLVLPNSIAEKNCFLDFYDLPAEKYHVAYNGIDPTQLKPVSGDLFCKEFGIEEKSFILCVANIEHRKNQYRLIEAANKLNMPLVLVGHVRDPHYYAECQKIMGDHIRYIGPLSHHSDLFKSAFAACKMHVLPGLLETPGLSSMEAAALGAPIVSTNEGSAREYFGDDIQYCDPLSVESICQAILQTMAKGVNTHQLSQRMLNQFTWKNTAEQTLTAYNAILSKK